jgi:hypothetical protein
MADHEEDWHDDDDDDDDDEEGDDFIPGADDEDEDDDDDDYDAEEDGNQALPPFLEGELFLDPSKGLCYEQPGIFCLASSQTTSFDLASPMPLDTPLPFAGWMQDPTEWLEFLITFSQQAATSGDPLEERLLKAQDEKNQKSNGSGSSNAPLKGSSDEGDVSQKQRATNLKAPPSHAEEDSKSPATASATAGKAPLSSNDDNITLVVMTGTQLVDGGKSKITFRGAYRPPIAAMAERLWVISSVQVEEPTTGAVAAGAVTASAAAPAAAAAARKRGRNDDDEDDDSVDGNKGVEYQELIDLHDDAGLSTEELRRRYYGAAAAAATANGDEDAKQPAKKGRQDKDDDDDDDDDYGF